MDKKYVHYSEVTREILNTIKAGDLVRVNNWDKPMQVKAVSENYFVMTQNMSVIHIILFVQSCLGMESDTMLW